MKSLYIIATILASAFLFSCTGSKSITEDPPEKLNYPGDSNGTKLEIYFTKGESHNHPSLVFWIEDTEGNFIKTLFINKAIGKAMFNYGDSASGSWKPGEIQRPASLPYWAHKRGVKNEYGNFIPSAKMPIPDAYTGPTPKRDFVLTTYTGELESTKFILKMEINQTWDWNKYWTNNKYPNDSEYKTSCQPALVYEVLIDTESTSKEYILQAIGHSHYNGSNGSLTSDLSTMTTALNIAEKIKVDVE